MIRRARTRIACASALLTIVTVAIARSKTSQPQPGPATSPESPPKPATAPATAPAGDWFGGANVKAQSSTLDMSEAGIFARLYPELARYDKTVRAATPRLLFDGLGAKGKPPLKMVPMIVPGGFFTEVSQRAFDHSKPPDPSLLVFDERRARFEAIRARQSGASLCFDIEALPLDIRFASAGEVDRSVGAIARPVGWARSQDPNLRLFFYSGFPVIDFSSAARRAVAARARPGGEDDPQVAADFNAWHSASARLARPREVDPHSGSGALAEMFDGTCPSLYLSSNDESSELTVGVQAFVRQMVNEARLYGKPIYPFLWYLEFDTKAPMALKKWTLLVRETMTWADGAVLWDGPTVWNNRLALRVRIAMLLAEHQGQMTDAEIYNAIHADFPGDTELNVLRDPATTQQTGPSTR